MPNEPDDARDEEFLDEADDADDVDFDALLEEMGLDDQKKEKKQEKARKAKEEEEEEILSLLKGDREEPTGEEVAEEDLLSGDDLLGEEAPAGSAGPVSSREGDSVESLFEEEEGEAEEIDLDQLIDEAEAATGVEDVAEEEEIDLDALVAAESHPSDSGKAETFAEEEPDDFLTDEAAPLEEETAEEPPTDEEAQEDEAIAEAKDKGRKGKLGKGIGKTPGKGMGKGVGKGIGKGGSKLKDRVKKDVSARKIAKPVPAAPLKGSVRFICSECYEEFLLSSTYSAETVTCPECLHVGKRPDDDFLRTVNVHKTGEKKSLAMTIIVGAVLVAAILFLIFIRSPFCNLEIAAQQQTLHTWTMGLLGLSGLLALILIWLLTRFEKNRWEVYF